MKKVFRDIIKKYLSNLKYGALPIMILAIIVLVAAFYPRDIVKDEGNKEVVIRDGEVVITDNDSNETRVVNNADTVVNAKTFVLNGRSDICNMISSFYNSLLTGDTSKVQHYYDNYENMNKMYKRLYAEYANKVQDINCYIIGGMSDKTYIVIATAKVGINNIDTLLPVIDYYYVNTDNSGNIYISEKNVSDEIKEYNQMIFKGTYASNLTNKVMQEYDNAVNKDANLRNLLISLQ